MASSNLLTLALFLVLLTHANSSNDASFNVETFNKTNLILQGDATVSSEGHLLLTNVKGNEEDSMGRAFYSAPIQINDRTIDNLASFSTNFTFRINAKNNENSAYGLAFALVPVVSRPKLKGRYLGLFKTANYDRDAHTVAVVFDTVSNRIEIDVNSIRPIATESCNFGHNNGEMAEVRITYDSPKNDLRVSLLYPSSEEKCHVSARVPLEKEVEDWVSVGFSATSGSKKETTETHNVLSWSFSSNFINFKGKKSERSNILLNKIL
uniref:Arcelin 6 n=1 Tax=Phaseolus vulgaris TaxID=3885 RepID=O24318_PHAVU|nr:arcelin 6 [Phaseolus vulgaris]